MRKPEEGKGQLICAGILAGLLLFLPRLHAVEALFNKGPFSDAVEERLIGLIDALPSGSSLDLCLYQFDRLSVFTAITNACRRSVRVRLAIEGDNAGPFCGILDLLPNASVVTERRSSLMHNKFILFDPGGSSAVSDTVWSGSMNLTANGMEKDAQNVVILRDLELAGAYAAEFRQMWSNNLFGTSKTGSMEHAFSVGGVPVEVWFSPKDNPAGRLAALIDGASSSVAFNIFTFTHAEVIAALTNAHRRGVRVTGVFDAWSGANYASYGAYTALTQARVPVFRDRVDGFPSSSQYLLHHKFMVIDAETPDALVVTGSFNWTGAGNDQNDENMLVIRDRCLAWRFLQEARARTIEADGIFDIPYEPPGLTGFTALPAGSGRVGLFWQIPGACGLEKVVFRYAREGYPSSPADGYSAGEASPSSGTHSVLPVFDVGERVYFKAFLYDSVGSYSVASNSCAPDYYAGEVIVSDNLIGPGEGGPEIILPSGSAERPDRVRVYDMNGRLVRRIVPPASGPARWDLRDDAGRESGPGIYYIAYRVSGRVFRNRIVVTR